MSFACIHKGHFPCYAMLHVVQVNSNSSHGMVSLVPRGRWVGQLSPLQLLKAVKNETEAKGMREAHVRERGGEEREGGRE